MTSAWLTGRWRKLIGPLSFPSLSTRITGALVALVAERVQRLVDARARAASAHPARSPSGSAARSSLGVARERRADRDLVPERADARDVVGPKPREELFATAARSSGRLPSMLPETSSMTMSRMGCGRVVEQRDRLRLALVAHFEVVARRAS